MIRYTLLIGLVFGGTAAALAHVQSHAAPIQIDQVAYASDDTQLAMAQPLTLQKCALEDCSDTPQN